jgi:5-formyltetrahydrofolate cyclo-ligase
MTERNSEEIAREKAALRRQFQAYRAGLDASEYAARSAAVVARVQALPEIQQAKTVHTYWPLALRREVDVRPLIDWLQQSGKQIVLPVVDTFGVGSDDTPRLRHVRFETAHALRPNRWGIHEPTGVKSVPVEDIDAVVVPALGAGRNGHRLGYGKGYYDAFLRRLAAPTLCPVYAACLVEQMPADAHDVPLDVVCTEHETIRL